MKIGYPCMNRTLKRGVTTFRLASYSPERMRDAVARNLDDLSAMLEYNAAAGLLFFRVSSQLVPFASHPVCRFPWRKEFKGAFAGVGRFIQKHGMRVSFHPDQFCVLNSPHEKIVANSVAELVYHAEMLALFGLDGTAKIQIHGGGVYGDKDGSLRRFAAAHKKLPAAVRRHLVVENDEWNFDLKDCLRLHEATGVPVLFDSFHHELKNNGETWGQGLAAAARTWTKADGLPMADYSSQAPGEKRGKHAAAVDMGHFRRFAAATRALDFDFMLEIKDKEASALKVLNGLRGDGRLAAGKTPPQKETRRRAQ